MSPPEIDLDGLVGPTHTFAGLASGNLAAAASRGRRSSPRRAALQGIDKMRRLVALGVPQGVLPPHERPHVATLRRLGFEGDDRAVLARVAREAPGLLAAVSSASSMWTANAATVSAPPDTADGRLHVTPANLVSQLHRSIEAGFTTTALRATLRPGLDAGAVVVHEALPATPDLGDEGAANHTRLVGADGAAVTILVHGRAAGDGRGDGPQRFSARQTLEASQAVARQHGLDPARTLHVRQHRDAIDAGGFHNDVVAVGHRHVLLAHEDAFADRADVVGRLRDLVEGLEVLEVPRARLSLDEAVGSYLFNSQLVTASDGRLVLVAPIEAAESPAASAVLDELRAATPIDAVEIVDLRESMANGGGPACLRLRLPLVEGSNGVVAAGSMVDRERLGELEAWVGRHHRDELGLDDLADPALLDESRAALDDLTGLLGLGPIYDFQR
ncbi:MAG: N-succinylarginine dihydrolase [Actinomycetota bacterium]|nr:N-succinylarginine dihydrolase [Actinomycetota bacterium]